MITLILKLHVISVRGRYYLITDRHSLFRNWTLQRNIEKDAERFERRRKEE